MIEYITDIKISLLHIYYTFKKIILNINDLIFLFDYQIIICIAHADRILNLRIRMEKNLFLIKMLKVYMLPKVLDKVT